MNATGRDNRNSAQPPPTTGWRPAILLLGPTGSGKSPLGDLIERIGLHDCVCHHFDFGHQLRLAAAATHASRAYDLTDAEIDIIRHSLRTGTLLEVADYGIALKILQGFTTKRCRDSSDILILNGLPRHVGQAGLLPRHIHVGMIVELDIEPDMVWRRIRRNYAGDRAQRADDTRQAVSKRLATYTQRTIPLIEYYGARGACLVKLSVSLQSNAEMLLADLRTKTKHDGTCSLLKGARLAVSPGIPDYSPCNTDSSSP